MVNIKFFWSDSDEYKFFNTRLKWEKFSEEIYKQCLYYCKFEFEK